MRRILTILVSVILLASLAAGSTAAKSTRLAYGHAQLALDGTAVGWVDIDVTTPTDADPSPGTIEFTGAPGYAIRSLEALLTDAAFYWDPLPAASAMGTVCSFAGVSNYTCAVQQIWIVDGSKTPGEHDWVVIGPPDSPNDGTWYQVVAGDIAVQTP